MICSVFVLGCGGGAQNGPWKPTPVAPPPAAVAQQSVPVDDAGAGPEPQHSEFYLSIVQAGLRAGYSPAGAARYAEQSEVYENQRLARVAAEQRERDEYVAQKKRDEQRQKDDEAIKNLAARRLALVRVADLASVVICSSRDDLQASRDAMAQERAGARESGYVDKSTMYAAGQGAAEAKSIIANYESSLRALNKGPIPCAIVRKRLGACYPNFDGCGDLGAVAKTAMYEFLWDDPSPSTERPEIVAAANDTFERVSRALDGAGAWTPAIPAEASP
jgi:hypothetical protein